MYVINILRIIQSVYVYFFPFFFLQNEVWMSVNILLYWMYVVRLNDPQWCAWQKKKKLIAIIYIALTRVCTSCFTGSTSSSNWILMSCQPHRVTSEQSNSGHKQIHISQLFSHIYQPSVKSSYKTNHFTNIKHTCMCIHKHQTQIFEVSPFNIIPVKKST